MINIQQRNLVARLGYAMPKHRPHVWVFSTLLYCITLPACAQPSIVPPPTAATSTAASGGTPSTIGAPSSPSTTSTLNSAPNQRAAFSDCSLIDFKDIDGRELTKAELVQKMDQDFADNLNRSDRCMEQAVTSNAERLGALGAAAQGDAPSAATTEGVAAANSEAPEISSGAQHMPSTPSTNTQKGQSKSGTSAVCDTVKQGLAGATTESEKTHFKALMTQYGCS
ncbi:hypothetical protein [Alishewanella tabrizica]|uniref:Secreted protein n=1 Tax=Alishewanella tabrizica TaxID=671278 RepID=A0ABQ2WG48_9ALTE|nr:hypothetical protein [Alishewanella tabrizica]GGW49712.1 hypothetical protein GCM10008111_01830 [Alishewanella tabrizica]